MFKTIENFYFKLYVKYFHMGVVFREKVWYNNTMYFRKLKKFFKKYL